MKKYCYITWYHPCLANRENLDNTYVLTTDSYNLLPIPTKNIFYSIIKKRAVGMNALMKYLKDKYYWLIVYHPKVKVNIEQVDFPNYSRVYYSDGLDWKNKFLEFNPMHFAFITRSLDYFPWDSTINDSESVDKILKAIKYSSFSKKINNFWLYD